MNRTAKKVAIVSGLGWLACLLAAPHFYASTPRAMNKLNDGWKFVPGQRDNARWEDFTITIPHTWNREDPFDDTPGYRRGVGSYRRELPANAIRRGSRVFLYFEGVGQVAEVFVNNKRVGKHIGGYTAFSFDISEFLKFDATNVIEVSADNTRVLDNPPIDGDFNMYGGIYRDVWLIETGPVHLGSSDVAGSGIAISTPQVSAQGAAVTISGTVVNHDRTVRTIQVINEILDPDGLRVVSKSSSVRVDRNSTAKFRHASIRVAKPLLWSPDSPNLYSVRTTIRDKARVLDEVTNPLGFRWYKFDAENGFFLNGKHLKLRGTNRHQDIDGKGNAVLDDLHVRDLKIIKDNGFNFLRLAHYPQDPALLDAADRLGVIIWEEIPIVNQIHVSDAFNENAETMLREMIRQHRNHPSILMWGYMNEVFLPQPKTDDVIQATVRLARQLESICRTEDPDRATVIAFDWGARDLYNSSGLGNVTQVVGWNLYHGWYYEKFEAFGKFLDEEHRKFPNRPLIISEYGANGDTRVHSIAPKRFDSSSEWQQMFHESYLAQIESRPFIAGAAIWNQFDFGSEFRGETMPHVNQKGVYTYHRQPKDVSFLYRANYSREPVVHIAAHDWPRRAGPISQTIVVYSNLDRLELFNNGVSLGTINAGPKKKATFSVTFIDGRNELRAVGRVGSKIISDRVNVDFQNPLASDVIAINCGANTEILDDDVETVWQADLPATGPRSWSVSGAETKSVDTRVNILKTHDDAIFQSMREGASTYHFEVPDGRYEIELRFAEPQFKAVGERVFAIKINDQTLVARSDVFAEAGYMTALTRREAQTASGGHGITIEFVPIKNLPIISGIRVKRI